MNSEISLFKYLDKGFQELGVNLIDKFGLALSFGAERIILKNFLIENSRNDSIRLFMEETPLRANEMISKNPFGFYVINSRLPPVGFSQELIEESKGGKLTGALWYQNLSKDFQLPVVFYGNRDTNKFLEPWIKKNKTDLMYYLPIDFNY